MDTKTEPQFQEVKDLTRIERIGAHSHIRGLGLNDVRFFLSSQAFTQIQLKIFNTHSYYTYTTSVFLMTHNNTHTLIQKTIIQNF